MKEIDIKKLSDGKSELEIAKVIINTLIIKGEVYGIPQTVVIGKAKSG